MYEKILYKNNIRPTVRDNARNNTFTCPTNKNATQRNLVRYVAYYLPY